MGGKSKAQTIGYKYYLGMHQVLCHGPIDLLTRATVDDRTAWSGGVADGSIFINADSLFGGDAREGGVSGTVDVMMGRPTQGQNSYLVSQLGSGVPGYRGVVSVVFRQCYLGNNPYLKPWRFRGQRINVRQNGIPQWYPARAAVYPPVISGGSQLWRYLVVPNSDNVNRSAPGFNDSSWATGRAPFADKFFASPGAYGFPTTPATVVPQSQKVWMRTTLQLKSVPPNMRFEAFVDNDCIVYVNGVQVLQVGGENAAYYDRTIPGSAFVQGTNYIAVVGWDRHSGSGNWFWFDWRLTDLTAVDMNGSHMIRECLTDPDWGMGYLDSDIDDASFIKAADTIANEGLGMSLLWDKSIQMDAFIDEVVKHIDAALYVSRTTGKFVLKLIRGDYDVATLLTLDESNISRIEDPARASFGELTNSVTVNYWDAETGKDASLTVTDTALVQVQGAVINVPLQYPGFTNARNAAIAGQRDLRTLSAPLLSCTVYADSTAADLNVGDVFKLSWKKWGLQNVVMRITGIAIGNGKNNTVKISCVQDVFNTITTSVVTGGNSEWEDPSRPPSPVFTQLVQEAPYYELVQLFGQSNVDADLNLKHDGGYVMAAAPPPDGAINARLWTDNGTGYVNASAMEFCPYAELGAAINKTQTVIPVDATINLDEVVLGTHCQCEGELMRVDAIDTVAGTITVGRGVLDTVPALHPLGAQVFFWDLDNAADPTEYVAGEEIDAKVLPVSGAGVVDIAVAEPSTVTLDGRAFRPYAPGDLRINGDSYLDKVYENDIEVSWKHRDRTQQTSGTLFDHTAADIGPEVGTTYRIEVIHNGLQILVVDDIDGNTETIAIPLAAGEVTLKVYAKREDVLSWQAANHTFTYTSGGLRFDEENNTRVTQDGDIRMTEDF